MTRRSRISRKSASALVITLSLLVILSIIVVAFLSQAILNRQLAFTSAGQIRAQVLADSARDLILSDLRSEIEAGSDLITAGTNTLYFPRTNAAAIPFRNASTNLPNLIGVSRAGSPLWTGVAYTSAGPTRSTQAVPSSTPSANGRYVKADRWNRPFLLGTNLPATFVVPDWFLITRGGALLTAEPSLTNLSDRSPGNLNAVIGRYAYAIYDEGGLLDINIAGNALSAATNARRGRLHQADLTRIPGIADPAALIAWRNAATASDPAWLDSATNSFLRLHAGDQRFVSRQDLIKYAQQTPSVLSTGALSYLGTFTREKNAPTIRPASVNPTNCIIPTVLRADGKPVMSRRFALGNLDLVKHNATADTSSKIYEKFGITRSSSTDAWVYDHGNGAKILTLAEVAQKNRDPDFFEVLKAVILEGSLGKTAGVPNNLPSIRDTSYRTAHIDVFPDIQIIRIGANLIDQYDADSWPTSISFQITTSAGTSNELSHGIENLPYINRMFDLPFRPSTTINMLGCWYEFEMWNPHQNPPASISQGPQSYRITATGGQAYASVSGSTSGTFVGPITTFTPGSHWITFNIQEFAEPTLLTGTNSSCDSPPPAPDTLKISGIYIGSADVSGAPDNVVWSAAGASIQPDLSGNYPTFELQYLSPEGQWVTYQKLANLRDSGRGGGGSNSNFKTISVFHGAYYFRGDPRNIRFGGGKSSGLIPPGATMRGVDNNVYPFKQDDGKFTSTGPTDSNPGWTLLATGNSPHARLAALANNDGSSSTTYKDPDGILRVGDGGLRGAAENPLQNGNTAARPIVLNRPFRSIADMGYAFRDLPWKTLDFFSANSADAALLDAFTLDEADTVAGKVNLNTRQPAVLEALLAGALRQETNLSQTISPTEAATIATDLVASTTNTPFINKADLVRLFSNTNVTTALPAIKTQREVVARALGEAGSIRTWNLLIDVIVQVGRYPTSAKTYADFNVEGERRYWIHLALDRYTGEIIDEQMEAVNE